MDEIDWSGIKAAAAVMGIREACRRFCEQAGLDEPSSIRITNRIRRRASRERWYLPDPKCNGKRDIRARLESEIIALENSDKKRANPDKKQRKIVTVPINAIVPTGAMIIQERLEEDSRETRLSLARASRRAAKHLETSDPDHVIENAGKMRDIAMVAEKVHQWDANTSKPAINLTFISHSIPDKDKQVEGEVIDV